MGVDIHVVAERQLPDQTWEEVTGGFAEGSVPFNWRSYSMFGFLAGERNYSAITPISQPRGLPEGFTNRAYFESAYWFGFSWLSTKELVDYDYDQVIEDRRCVKQVAHNSWNGGHTCEPAQGERMMLREFLGESFFSDLAMMQKLGIDRIVFGFDC